MSRGRPVHITAIVHSGKMKYTNVLRIPALSRIMRLCLPQKRILHTEENLRYSKRLQNYCYKEILVYDAIIGKMY